MLLEEEVIGAVVIVLQEIRVRRTMKKRLHLILGERMTPK
jgi:hypothetical protein